MSPTDLAAHYRGLTDKHDRDLYDGDRNAPGLTVRMADQEASMKSVCKQLEALGFEDGMARDFITFKTEILTIAAESNRHAKSSNSRMNLIIAGLGLLVAAGILCATLLGIALTRPAVRSMLMTTNPVVTAYSTASTPDDVN